VEMMLVILGLEKNVENVMDREEALGIKVNLKWKSGFTWYVANLTIVGVLHALLVNRILKILCRQAKNYVKLQI
jgi:hypothetical protein